MLLSTEDATLVVVAETPINLMCYKEQHRGNQCCLLVTVFTSPTPPLPQLPPTRTQPASHPSNYPCSSLFMQITLITGALVIRTESVLSPPLAGQSAFIRDREHVTLSYRSATVTIPG
ncbi:hypothetical protein J6590_014601 [Homalodisca vitripennis]|nr:hypothetical protein J6590_014601 [Homalodisca vitripennis]